jgi:hypothetical protein
MEQHMTPLLEIGEIGVSDGREGGKDYLLRPSFMAMTRIGTPEEIVQAYADIHGNEALAIIELCSRNFGRIPEWIQPAMNSIADKLLTTAMRIIQSCCDSDLTPIIGEWKGWSRYVVYRPGLIPKNDMIVIAQQLMQHGVIGKAKVRKLQRHESNKASREFNAFDYINSARNIFGMSRDDASNLTMTEFALLIAAKYPEQKGLTQEEYADVSDDFLARQAARRARAKR